MTETTLRFRDVTVSYGRQCQPTLRCVSFALAPGERTALLGVNGSGKTTLLTAAVGLVPHEGEIVITGKVLTPKTLSALRSQIGFVFNVPEDQLLFPTVLDDVAFGLLRQGHDLSVSRLRARRQLQVLGIEAIADCPIHQLSHGQKQRVALAGAIVTAPSLLLLDEPTAGLDPPGKRALLAHLTELDASMLLATHDIDFASRICSRFLILSGGSIVFDGSTLPDVSQYWDG